MRAQGSGLRAQGAGFRDESSGFRLLGEGFQIEGFEVIHAGLDLDAKRKDQAREHLSGKWARRGP